ncbi:DoxX family protein [Ensifer adhaerens]|uniref:DoxX family protein n=1 Tax=Ensifer adhaerens TaxID=106592 RepID=UPI001CC07486|nr:DoxX family protein [Ensifer adhaerens]MBZ7924784.1 DoxX family protein [Ensifer adhaerens]UAX95995.1 DoxX family protein [Ensifer adhaerens]UAY04663.1 DoxX family protein [Ensifer adhaerens]UAY10094.1 DoxX family protein [Ensifer adhaerens]
MTMHLALSALLAIVLAWAGLLNLAAPAFVRAEFEKWGYPPALRVLVGLMELCAAVLLLWPNGQRLGALIGGLVLLGVVASLLRTREWLRLEYPLVLLAAVALVALV